MRKLILLAVMTTFMVGCGEPAVDNIRPSVDEQGSLSGKVQLDGSSTVFPISEAVAEDFGCSCAEGQSDSGRIRHWWWLQEVC